MSSNVFIGDQILAYIIEYNGEAAGGNSLSVLRPSGDEGDILWSETARNSNNEQIIMMIWVIGSALTIGGGLIFLLIQWNWKRKQRKQQNRDFRGATMFKNLSIIKSIGSMKQRAKNVKERRRKRKSIQEWNEKAKLNEYQDEKNGRQTNVAFKLSDSF